MRDRKSTKGFTLIELIIVVAIVAILLSVAAFTFARGQRRISVERATANLRGRIHRVQSLAAVAGSRVGPKRTAPRLRYAAGCPADAPGMLQLWIRVDTAQQVTFPVEVEYDENTDELEVRCETVDLTLRTTGFGAVANPATIISPPAGTLFSFTPTGRLVLPAPPIAPIYFELQGGDATERFGFRILPSGVTCVAPGAAIPPLCSEDLG